MSNEIVESIRKYFWVVHYVVPQAQEVPSDGALRPIPAGKGKFVVIIARNAYGRHAVGFDMPREHEADADPAHFRGAANRRIRMVGFYSTPEEANNHLSPELWKKLQGVGAVYAELHGMKLDVPESEALPKERVA